jgi:hypothetical protein
LDSDLTTIAGLTPTTNNFMVANASAWSSRTPAQALAHLGLDADLATFVVPASTTISTFGATLVDDADNTTARSTLGLVIGTNVQAFDADLTTLSTSFVTASAAGPASLALHEDTDNGTNKVTITAPAAVASDKIATLQDVTGTILVTGGTDVAVADGGTGASDATNAKINLGLEIGVNVQAFDADLSTIAGLTPTTNNFMVANASAWSSRTPTQAIAHLGLDADLATFAVPANTTISAFGATLVDDADNTTARTTLGLAIGTDVPAYNETKSVWMSFPGVQIVGTGVLPMYFPYTVEILNFHLSGLTNTTVTLDVNRSGTTMFVTQGNRPALSASQTDATSVPDAATNNQLTTSQYLTIDIDVATGSPANFMLRCDYKRI